MRVIVTGGLGYIGSHICIELINHGYEVVIIDNDKLSTGRLVLSLQKKDYTVTEFFNHQQVSFYYYLIHPLFQAIDYYKRNCDSIPIILISNKLLREISVRGIKKLREFESIELYVFVINVIRK